MHSVLITLPKSAPLAGAPQLKVGLAGHAASIFDLIVVNGLKLSLLLFAANPPANEP